jgi:hypothetical protein
VMTTASAAASCRIDRRAIVIAVVIAANVRVVYLFGNASLSRPNYSVATLRCWEKHAWHPLVLQLRERSEAA